MGWTVLYIAFGVVALWLLGEVLLQYKARLRYRLLAFFGFLGVVGGVLMPSIMVIGTGAATFAVGQTFVTLSFRKGFAGGWAIGGRPDGSDGGAEEAAPRDPVASDPAPAVTDLERTAVHQLGSPPDDTGQYGGYGREEEPQPYGQGQYATAGYDQQGIYPDPHYPATGDPYAGAEFYRHGGEQPAAYAAYSDPYIGNTSVPAQPQPYENFDTYAAGGIYAGRTDQYTGGVYDNGAYTGGVYDHGGYHSGAYATQADAAGYGTGQYPHQQAQDPYPAETPPGGVWVPQQRESEMAAEQSYPYRDGNGYYHDPQQQRY
jgi:hypothetical protein